MPEITVICGCFGSGKTEFSMSLAREKAAFPGETALVDLDTVNPMFNCEHHREEIQKNGVHLISTPIEKRCDCPSLSPEIYAAFTGRYEHVVFDLGGDKVGSTVLGSFYDRFKTTGAKVRTYFIVNTRRPMSSDVEGVISALDRVRRAARLPVNGLINNTNLGSESTWEHLAEGEHILSEVSARIGIPVVCYVGTKAVLDAAPRGMLHGEPFEIKPINRPVIADYRLGRGIVHRSGEKRQSINAKGDRTEQWDA